MENVITVGIAMLLIYAIIGFFVYVSNKDKKIQTSTIRLSIFYLLTGIIATLGFAMLSIFMVISGEYDAWILFFLFSLPSASLIIAFFNCRIFYDEESVTYRNFWGKETTIRYTEIIDIEINFDILICSNDKKINIKDQGVGRIEFLKKITPYIDPILKKKKQSLINLPKVRKYRDSVHRAGEFYFGMIVIMVLYFVIMVVMFLEGEFIIGVGAAIFALGLDFLIFYSAKRAHSSKFWYVIAKKMYKQGCLKLDNDDLNKNK